MITTIRSKKTADALANSYKKDGCEVEVTKVSPNTPYCKKGFRYYVEIKNLYNDIVLWLRKELKS